MIDPRQHIANMAEICYQKGIKCVVISPGSRNAPLISAFYKRFGPACISLVDERSAAFFALGIARCTRTPVVLVCSSGSAGLNFAPALAEAFYQHVALIAITADRPQAWIDQQDNQALRQNGIFSNYIKKSYNLPMQVNSDDDCWFAEREINDAINTSNRSVCGPVHINMPLEEPLYTELPAANGEVRVIDVAAVLQDIDLSETMVDKWMSAEKILIVHGQDFPNSGVTEWLERLSDDPRIALVAENIANVQGENILANPELLLAHSASGQLQTPDLVLYSGGQIVSKKMKGFLRSVVVKDCWRIGLDTSIVDTFKQATLIIPFAPELVYSTLAKLPIKTSGKLYGSAWKEAMETSLQTRDAMIHTSPFSDLTAIHCLCKELPLGTALELGNSTAIRYSQLCDVQTGIDYYSNRGVSGIDGCVSTAAGTAAASGKLTVCIVGDLSFVYDSNALWNRELSYNLRVVVMNNKGGGIFNLLGSSLENPLHKNYVEAYHPVNIQKLAEAFGLRYFCSETMHELREALPAFYQTNKTAALLEVKTNTEINTQVFYTLMGNGIR